ncbi:hypothetical protein H4R34_000755 [Dimargaris verticillata]|uniref:Uncharacterized protein n=1 Tax=Dimargaris verticillata TaxID=2761393 RepID=A0A9W8EEE5_9FUNG|nr:hypothetical protein H4R34_000755 [Dimargaris verticillata]
MSSRPTRHTESRHMRHGPSEYDKLRQAIPQPVQTWVKQWTTPTSDGHAKSARSTYRSYRWTRASKPASFATHLAYSSDEETSTMVADDMAQSRGTQDLDLCLGDIPIPIPASQDPSRDLSPPASAVTPSVSTANEPTSPTPSALVTQAPDTEATTSLPTLASPVADANNEIEAKVSPRLSQEPPSAMETD